MTPTTPPAIPSDIPAAIWDTAYTVAILCGATLAVGAVEAIARALLAAQERGKLMERERCAGIADADWEIAGKFIAAAIRKGVE